MLTLGGLIASTMLSGRALAPLGQVVGLLLQFENAKNSMKALEGVMTTPNERSEESSFVHRPEIRGEIEFRDVHFCYPGSEQTALRGVNFTIKQGEHVVVIGRVGCMRQAKARCCWMASICDNWILPICAAMSAMSRRIRCCSTAACVTTSPFAHRMRTTARWSLLQNWRA
jgi:hypothetical protein